MRQLFFVCNGLFAFNCKYEYIPDKYRSEAFNAYLIQIEAMTEDYENGEGETVF